MGPDTYGGLATCFFFILMRPPLCKVGEGLARNSVVLLDINAISKEELLF